MKFYQVAKLIKFNFTEISQFLWHSLGSDVKIFDFSFLSQTSPGIKIDGAIYTNTKGEVLYFESEEAPSGLKKIWISPAYHDAYIQEHIDNGVQFNEQQAHIFYKEEEVLNYIMGNTYNNEQLIDIELEDDVILEIAKEAHKKDITLNDMVVYLIENHMKIIEKSKQ